MADLDGSIVVAVDDDASMRRVLARVLAWRGCQVIVAATREEGVQHILRERPAVVTVDYDLGPDTGADLVHEVRRALGDHAPPFILVSAAADRIPRGERALFDAWHVKPFRASALLDDVARLAARGASHRSGVRAASGTLEKRRTAEGE
ncbi:MAG: response regulator [Sandaracinaceae bacterium]|nr:response regulator [Sandaracinaceae bacterium]